MRLDLFLKASRLVLRRTLAQQLCDAGHVKLNGAKAKSSKEVKAGDLIALRRRNKILNLKIVEVPSNRQVSKASAAGLYEVISEVILETPLTPSFEIAMDGDYENDGD
jgi:ribosomal 50S subunit-recycling heat shock protein